MTVYFNYITKEYPRHDGDLEILGWTQGNTLPEGWVEVSHTEPPTVEDGFIYEEVEPKNIDGIWKMQWTIKPMTENQIFMKNNPHPRDGKHYIWDNQDMLWKQI